MNHPSHAATRQLWIDRIERFGHAGQTVAQFGAWYKRLEQGTLELPITDSNKPHMTIDSVELAMWIAGVSLKSAKPRRKRMKVA